MGGREHLSAFSELQLYKKNMIIKIDFFLLFRNLFSVVLIVLYNLFFFFSKKFRHPVSKNTLNMSTLCFGNLVILLFEVLSFYVNIYVILRALLQISAKNLEFFAKKVCKCILTRYFLVLYQTQ